MEIINKDCHDIIKNILTDVEIKISKKNKEKLMLKRLKINEELEKIDQEIEQEIYNTITLCKFSERGHQFISERDPGPYGQCWNVCTVCGYEY